MFLWPLVAGGIIFMVAPVAGGVVTHMGSLLRWVVCVSGEVIFTVAPVASGSFFFFFSSGLCGLGHFYFLQWPPWLGSFFTMAPVAGGVIFTVAPLDCGTIFTMAPCG